MHLCLTVDKLKKDEPSVETVVVDLLNWESTKEALKSVGQIDFLVNCAGIAIIEPLTKVSHESVSR